MHDEYAIQDALDYVFRGEQSGIHTPDADWQHLVVLAGAVNRLRTEVVALQDYHDKAEAAIDKCIDELAGV